MYKLKIQDDEGRSTRVPMLKDEMSIGRDEGNTIRLTDRNVSRNHARLVQRQSSLHLLDLSRYGTQVNGMRIDGEHALNPHDVIQIGDYELSLEREGDLGLKPTMDDTAATLEGAPPPEELALVDPGRERAQFGQAAPPRESKGRPRFMILSGALAGTELQLESDEVAVGRGGDADIQIDHRSISRSHAEIRWDGQQCILLDTGSSNGVKVNGEAYTQSVLRRGDVIELGHVRLRYLLAGEVFTFDPATMTHDLEARSRSTLRLFLMLLVVAVGLGFAWMNFFSKPSETPRRNETASRDAPQPEPRAVEPAAAEAPAPVVRDPKALIRTAMGHIKAERWSEAIPLFSEALTRDSTSIDAKAGLMHANNELVARSAYQAVSALLKRGELDEARAEVSRLDAIEETSVYHARALELRKAIEAGLISHLLDRGDEALKRRTYSEAKALANEVLALDPSNRGAADLKVSAEKRAERRTGRAERRRQEVASKTGQGATTAEDKRPAEPPPDRTGTHMTAKDYYTAARKVHNSDPSEALSLYKKAASKGYARAWRQMGSLHLKNGNTGAAVKSYKRYLNLSPGASDAEVIRNTIVRLGGAP
jgi:pSer/pThr/pTyr-binding forkhead associated (FHA) protein/tetratricopeptide (TPR) repeat protein